MGPLFYMIGPRVSPDRTSSKTQRSYSNETPCMLHMKCAAIFQCMVDMEEFSEEVKQKLKLTVSTDGMTSSWEGIIAANS